MSVPKKRQASGRTKRRRSHHKLSTIPHKVNDDGTITRRHHATAEDLAKK
ncbi:MAG: 50S ribosomal protein L32 [Proteobacteria bacterium]|nr:50S ribosomal protein L32 [Pseudomonadota bacterium]